MESKYKLRLIEKHGLEKGSLMYENWYSSIKIARKKQYSVEYWIQKYGEIDGPKKLEEYKSKTSGSKSNYEKKYGKKLGVVKYNEFRKKCSLYNSEHRIEKYGTADYETQIKKYKSRKNVVSFTYFLDKYDGEYDKAILAYKDRQSTSTLEKFIKNYGEIDGTEKYKNCIQKKVVNFQGKSKFETDFLDLLIKNINEKFNNIYYNDNKYMFFSNKEYREKYNKKAIFPDMYIKDINVCIEVFGDWWHCNPEKFDSNYYHTTCKKFSYEIWQEDANRIKLLKDQYNVSTIVVWENEIKKNKNGIIKIILEKLNGFSKIAE